MTDEQTDLTSGPLVIPRSVDGLVDGKRHPRRVFLGRLAAGGVAVVTVAVGTWVLFGRSSDDGGQGLLFVIPVGAAEAVGGSTLLSAIEMPTKITFLQGDVPAITIRNEESVSLRAGPWIVGPGQTYTQRFPSPGEYPITCSVDPTESIVVTVVG